MAKALNYNLNFKANTKEAETALKQLQTQLEVLYNNPLKFNTASLKQAKSEIQSLSRMLNASTNSAGKLNLGNFNTELKKAGMSVEQISKQMLNFGKEGQQAFASFAKSVATAQQPIKQTSKMLDELWVTMKNTIRWQVTTMALGGFTGAISDAVSYAHQLDSALRDIRIVSGESAESMEKFAIDASKAAKRLSSTTKDYAEGALIYYQQGLDQEESRARTETTLKMANVTGDSAVEVSSYMTAIWNNYAKGSENLEHFTDVMADLGARTASSSSEIADGLQQFVSLGPVIGLSFDNAAAALAAVSSSTRESAATIGNSFKTIFARLQGLKLGDTLDDGTDLNKYSKALATAGVQIKDSTGQLKDADIILDELMDKWDSLTKDQQVATAQTVAGVHQYARFMSLMEAKDAYRQNLQWAQNADGAVDEQMKYYEESWTAAQDRFKDSLNQVYNQLDIEDGAKALYGTLDKVASSTANILEQMGGVKTLFLAIAGIAGGAFSTQINGAFNRINQNFKVWLKGSEMFKNLQTDMMISINSAKEKITDPTILKNIEAQEHLIQVRQKALEQSKNLTEQEQQYNNVIIQNLEAQNEAQEKLRESLVEQEDLRIDKTGIETDRFLAGKKVPSFNDAIDTAIVNDISNLGNVSNLEDLLTELTDRYQKLIIENNRLSEASRLTSASITDAFSATGNSTAMVQKQVSNAVKTLKDYFPTIYEELAKNNKGILDSLENMAISDLDTLKQYADRIVQQLNQTRNQVREQRNDLNSFFSDIGYGTKPMIDRGEKYWKTEKQMIEGQMRMSQAENSIITQSAGKSPLESMLKLSSAAGQAALAISSLQSIKSVFSDEATTSTEKMVSILMSLSLLLPSLKTGFDAFNTFNKKVSEGRGKAADAKNNIVSEDRIKELEKELQSKRAKINVPKQNLEEATKKAKIAQEEYTQAVEESEKATQKVVQKERELSKQREKLKDLKEQEVALTERQNKLVKDGAAYKRIQAEIDANKKSQENTKKGITTRESNLEEFKNTAKEAAQGVTSAKNRKDNAEKAKTDAEDLERNTRAQYENAKAAAANAKAHSEKNIVTSASNAITKLNTETNLSATEIEILKNEALAAGIITSDKANQTQRISIALEKQGVLATMMQASAEAASAAGAGMAAQAHAGLAAALQVAKVAALEFATALLSNPLFWFAAAAAAVVASIWAISKAMSADTDALAKNKEKLEELNQALSEAKSAYEGIKDAQSVYDEAKSGLDNVVKGTQDWYEALDEVNQKILEILANYPELWAYVSQGENGLEISKEGWDNLIEQKRKEVADKQAAQIAGQNAVWDSENVVNRNNVKRKDRKYLDYYTEGTMNETQLRNQIGASLTMGLDAEEFGKLESKMAGLKKGTAEYNGTLVEIGLNAKKWEEILAEVDSRTQSVLEAGNKIKANTSSKDNALESYFGTYLSDNEVYNNSKNKDAVNKALFKKYGKDVKDFYKAYERNSIKDKYEEASGLTKDDEGYLKNTKAQAEYLAMTSVNAEEAEQTVREVDEALQSLVNTYGETTGGILGQLLTGGSLEGYTDAEIDAALASVKTKVDALGKNASPDKIAQAVFGVDGEQAIEYMGLFGEESAWGFIKRALNAFNEWKNGSGGAIGKALEGTGLEEGTKKAVINAYDKLSEDDKKIALEVVPKLTEEDAKEFVEDSSGFLKKYQDEIAATDTLANITKEIDAAKDAGKAYDFTAENVSDYAKQLQKAAKSGKDVDKTLQDSYNDCLDLAFAYEKMNQGIEAIRDNGEDWVKILKSQNTLSPEYSEALNNLGDALQMITGVDFSNVVDGGLDLNFLTTADNLKLVSKAAAGSTEKIEQLRMVCAKQIIVQAVGKTDFSEIPKGLQDLTNMCINWVNKNKNTLKVGAQIDDRDFVNTLNAMVRNTQITTSQIQSFLSAMGIEGEIEMGTETVQMPTIGSSAGQWAAAVSSLGAAGLGKALSGKQTTYERPIRYIKSLRYKPVSGAYGAKTVNSKPSSGGKSKRGKGGGGGSSNKYEPDKLDDEFDKYYYYKKSIEDLGKAYDKLAAARNRAYEPKKYYDDTAAMNANIEARIRVYNNYIKVLKEDVIKQKENLGKLGAKFDSWGNMTNYEAFMKNRMDNYQMRLNKAGNDDAASKIKEKWEAEKKEVEKWQENHDTLTDIKQAREELKNTLIDNKLDSFQFELDVNTDKAEVALDHISSRLSHLDHYKLNVSLLVDAQEDELGEMLNKLEYQRHYLRQLNIEAATDGMNKNLQDAINETRKNIDSLVTDIENKVDDIGNDIQKIFDDLDDRLDSTKNRLSSFGDILSNMKDIINLSGQKYTKNETFKALQYSMQQTNKQNVELLKGQVDAQKDIVQKLKNAREELAGQGADEAVLKQWDDKIKEAEEQYTSLGAELTSALQDSISNIMDAAVEALEDAMKKAEMKLFNIGDLEMAKNYYEEYQDLSEEYLDNTEKTYELGKLMRQINNSIADKNNITGAKELAELADEVTKKQEKGVKLSQYDVDLLNAKYQLTLAQIALEEAQNNKTTMRLRRDASGNYSYVYTADADAISNAEQTVEDKQKNLYDISKDYAEKIAASWFDVLQQYEERVQELQEKYQAGIITQTEFNEQKKELDRIYADKIKYIYGELNKVYENSTLTFKDSNLQKATSMNELVDIYEKSNEFIKDISTDATQNAQDQADAVTDILGSVGIEVGKLADAFNTANTNINSSVTSMVASTKTSLAEFNASLDTSIQKIKEYAAAASAAFGKTGDAYVATGDVTGFTGDLSKQYMNAVAKGDMELANQLLEARAGKMAGMDANTLSSLISNERLQKWTKYYNNPDSAYYEAAQDMLDAVNNGGSALQWWVEIMNKITKDNPYKKPSSFDSGGYTGPWGSEGKLALLHEKELILNKTDTENILDAVNIIRSMSQSITSSLVNDLVDLVASWNRLTTNVNSSTEKIPQVITIDASFPNVSVASEIEEAFNDLANQAAQFASIKRV